MTKTYKQPEEGKIDELKLNEPSYLTNSIGSIETVTVVPTGIPSKMINQIKFYSSGATYRIYFYDVKNGVWRYSALT